MPDQEYGFLNEEALVWLYIGNDQYGAPSVAPTPLILSPKNRPANGVRWVRKPSRVHDPKRGVIELDSSVQLTIPLPINSRIWFGSIEIWNQNKPSQDVMLVVYYTETQDIKGRTAVRICGLQKVKNI